ncbi:MAG TPA: hypothetical protein DCG49_09930 [Ruminococcus sp.]|nr:hypothetical protein [Ruminococcus sp.]
MRNQKKQRKSSQAKYAVLCMFLIFLTIYTIIFFIDRKKTQNTAADDIVETGINETLTVTAPQTTAATIVTTYTTAADFPETVQTEPAVTQVPRNVFLTFDDGPCENTPEVLSILDQYGARATFFTVGFYVDRYPELVGQIADHGNLIACHSYTHDLDQCYASADTFMGEVHQWEEAVINACGFLPDRICVRFPGGSTTKNAAPVKDEIFSKLLAGNYRWFDWNAGDNDKWPKGNTENLPEEEYFMESYRQCIGWYKDTPETPVVILFHDTEIGTVHILPEILQDLIDRGYRFKTLDEHPDWN